jgi:phenylacetate-CoA ligase
MEIWNRHFECMDRDELKKVQDNLESSIGLGIKVTLVEPKIIGRSEGKAQHVIDKRKF